MRRLQRMVAALFAGVALLFPAAAAAELCPSGDLLSFYGVSVSSATSGDRRVIDGGFVSEGADSERDAVRIEDRLLIDLGSRRLVRALTVQADFDDVYTVEGSPDGRSWTPLAIAREVAGGGLRSRSMRLSRPAEVRLLRIVPSGGDGTFHVAKIAAWCVMPERPPGVNDSVAPRERIRMPSIGFAIALLGLALFSWGVWAGDRWRRARDVALLLLGLAAGLAWWNFGTFHSGRHVHVWEQFHYFLGGKYFPELGYGGLYECATRADLEDGLASRVRTRRIRDMSTNRTISASTLADPPSCKQGFRPERWTAFKQDVAWFRTQLPPPLWERIFLDHGFNAPPAWTILGGTLTRNVPANDTTILALSLIDPVLLLLMWGLAVRAFGWRAICVALLWWGTNRLAYFGWTGGGLLRQDWLVLSILGICLVRRRHPLLGGAALGYATLLRVFPGLLVAAVVLQAAARSLHERRWAVTTAQWQIVAGCAAAMLLLVPLSAATSHDANSWGEFIDNSRANYRATGVNMVGLMAALTYDHDQRKEAIFDPDDESWEERWREGNRALFRQRRPLLWFLVAAFVPLFAWAVRRESEWVALALGIGLIPIGLFAACYYYGILLGFGLLHRRWGDVVGIVVCSLSVATHVGERLWPTPMGMETRFAWASVATVLAVLALTLLAWRRPASPTIRPASPTAPRGSRAVSPDAPRRP